MSNKETNMTDEKTFTEQEAHRFFGGQLNGTVWQLLEKADRSADEDERMVHAAHGSLYHWLQVGTALHQQRGEWMLSHVYAELGRAEAALRYAQRCQQLTEAHAELMADFDVAYAYEALARANAVAGNRGEAEKYLEQAEAAGQRIEDEESKKYFFGDFHGGKWYGLR